jgi:hypothetical protein
MFEAFKTKLSAAVSAVKNAMPKIDLKNIQLPKNTADVEWKDGQPVFTPKKDTTKK